MYIYNMIIICSFSFMMMKHPLSMGLILIIQTIFIALMIGLLSQSFWFSYVLFLIMVGGMLIMFIYVISMVSNKKFIQKYQQLWIKLIFLGFVLFLMKKNIQINNFEIFKTEIFFNTYDLNINILKLYNFPINLITLMMMNYLFLLLIIAVKITNFFLGPMRLNT